MNFKNPEILYALLLLLIPIIIHLVHWKRYKKEIFTNIDFLQELEIKSRKSRKLKEILILLARLLTFASIILAFAHPFIPSIADKTQQKETQNIIYLDNSLSMSATKYKDNLLNINKFDLMKAIKPNKSYTFFTNDKIYKNINGEKLKDLLFKIKFSSTPTNHNKNLQKAKLLFDKSDEYSKNLIYISDLQSINNTEIKKHNLDKNINYYIKSARNENLENISIDTLIAKGKSSGLLNYDLILSANKEGLKTAIKIMENNHILWNDYVDFKDSLKISIPVQIDAKNNISGVVEIEDEGFHFDNNLYFTYNQPEKLKILFIGEKLPKFIKKIYTPDEFILDNKKENQVDYNNLSKYQLIIFYQTDFSKLPYGVIKKYIDKYGNIAVIPKLNKNSSPTTFIDNINNIGLNIQPVSKIDTNKVVLNKINYSSPFFKGIFLKKTNNFSYPFVRKHLKINTGRNWLYKLNDQTEFVTKYSKNGNIYVFNTDLSSENTNFTEAPYLVVPLFYQMAKIYQNNDKTYFLLKQNNTWTVNKQLEKDRILKLKKDEIEIIPYQTRLADKVRLNTTELPDEAGIYQIIDNQKVVGNIAYNANRKENTLNFILFPKMDNIHNIQTVADFSEIQEKINNEKPLWKIFVILGLLFLLIEFLIIKFWK